MGLPDRKPQRLKGYDYSNKNLYFVTICTHNKIHLFGNISELNDIGKIAENELLKIPSHFDCVQIDKYVIMPNHIHAMIAINHSDERPLLSTIVGLYKSGVSKRIHEFMPDITIWQKSFYDHIIRDEQSYRSIWQYIEDNPKNLSDDELLND